MRLRGKLDVSPAWARRQEWKEEPHSPGFRDVSARIVGLPPGKTGQSLPPSDLTGWGEPSPRQVCVWFVLVTTVCFSAPARVRLGPVPLPAPHPPPRGRSVLKPERWRTVLIRNQDSLWLLRRMRSSVARPYGSGPREWSWRDSRLSSVDFTSPASEAAKTHPSPGHLLNLPPPRARGAVFPPVM